MKQENTGLIAVWCMVFLIAAFPLSEGIIGSWKFTVPQTVPEYNSGTLVFEEAENNEFSGKIIFNTGREITLQSVSVEADTVTFIAFVDGSLVTTVCTLLENELNGFVRTPDGDLNFTAEREE